MLTTSRINIHVNNYNFIGKHKLMTSNKFKITSPEREGKEEKETNWKICFICQEDSRGKWLCHLSGKVTKINIILLIRFSDAHAH